MKGALLIWFLIFTSVCFSQNDSSVFVPQFRKGKFYTVKTTTGVTYKGFLTQESREFITIEDKRLQQAYEIRKREIAYIRAATDGKAEEDLWGLNYHSHTYMLSGSSLVYEKPSVTINTQWFLFDNSSIRINDNWDLTSNSLLMYPTSLGLKCAYQIAPDIFPQRLWH